MNLRLFTAEEANRHLPLVRSITRDAVHHYHLAKREIAGLERLKAGGQAGRAPSRAALDTQDSLVALHLEILRGLIEELEGLGCHLRDYERGVVDFPAASVDSEGFLVYCWTLGEERVSHWHSEHEGHAERRQLAAF